MPGRGPAPKDPATRRRRNATPPPTVVSDDDEVRGPELPAECYWPEQTRRWWHTWRTSPQAQAMTATDWDFLLDTALLHRQLWSGDDQLAGKAATEVRLRVAKFGATPEDRLRLRLQVAPSAPAIDTVGKTSSRYGHLRAVGE